MEWAQFALDAAKALAWPIVAVVIAIMYRRHIHRLLDTGLKRSKAGPFEAEWDQAAAETRTALEDQGILALEASRVQALESEPPSVVEDSIAQNTVAIMQMISQRSGERADLAPLFTEGAEIGTPMMEDPKNRVALVLVTVEILRSLVQWEGDMNNSKVRRTFEGLLRLRDLAVHLDRPLTRGEIAEFMLLSRILVSHLPTPSGARAD